MSHFDSKQFEICQAGYSTAYWQESVELQRQVYCDERGFEERPLLPKPNYFDHFDGGQAQRIAVISSGHMVATTRVLSPGEYTLPALYLMPELSRVLGRARFVEVSGFCCSKVQRTKLHLSGMRAGRYITFLLLATVAKLARNSGSQVVLMTIEPGLFRYLSSLGFPLYPVGEPVEHHGLRQVCYGYLEEGLIPGVLRKCPREWNRAMSYELIAGTEQSAEESCIAA